MGTVFETQNIIQDINKKKIQCYENIFLQLTNFIF